MYKHIAANDVKVKIFKFDNFLHKEFKWALMLNQSGSDVVLSWHSTREDARKTAKEIKKALSKLYPNKYRFFQSCNFIY